MAMEASSDEEQVASVEEGVRRGCEQVARVGDALDVVTGRQERYTRRVAAVSDTLEAARSLTQRLDRVLLADESGELCCLED